MYLPSLLTLQDIHFLLSLCTVFADLAELQAWFMLAESYKHFNLCTDKCRNLQLHSWETDDTAGALARIQVPHYFYHDSSGNLRKRQSSLLQLRKARKKTSGEFKQLGWRNVLVLCNS